MYYCSIKVVPGSWLLVLMTAFPRIKNYNEFRRKDSSGQASGTAFGFD